VYARTFLVRRPRDGKDASTTTTSTTTTTTTTTTAVYDLSYPYIETWNNEQKHVLITKFCFAI